MKTRTSLELGYPRDQKTEAQSPRKKWRNLCGTGETETTQENKRQIIMVFGKFAQIDEETTTIERNEDENESRVGLSTRTEDGSTISTKKVEKSVWHRGNGGNS